MWTDHLEEVSKLIMKSSIMCCKRHHDAERNQASKCEAVEMKWFYRGARGGYIATQGMTATEDLHMDRGQFDMVCMILIMQTYKW